MHRHVAHDMSRTVRKPDFCICKNKGADQLCGNRTTDQHLCFRYIDSTIPLLPKYEIASRSPSSVTAQPGLCHQFGNPEDRFSHNEAHIYLCMFFLKFYLRCILPIKDQTMQKCNDENAVTDMLSGPVLLSSCQ